MALNVATTSRGGSQTPTTCIFWIAGKCNRNPCRFLHSQTPSSSCNAAADVGYHYPRKRRKHHSSSYVYQRSKDSALEVSRNPSPSITGMTILPSSDKLLYTGSTDGTVRTWDYETGKCGNVANLGSEVTSLFSDDPWIFVGLLNTVMAYNTQTDSQYTLDGPIGQVRAMIVVIDTHTLLAGAENGVISAWRNSPEGNSPFKLVTSLHGHTKSVVCLVIGARTKLYSGSEDQSIKVWDLETFELKMTLNAHIDTVTSLICWEQYLLSGSSDCTIKVWSQTEDGNLEVIHSHNVENGVAFSGMHDPDKKPILLCSTKDNSVHFYELPSFVERGRLFRKQEVVSVCAGPDGFFFTGDRGGLLTVSKWLGEQSKKLNQFVQVPVDSFSLES